MEYRGGLREYERENMLPLQEEKLAKAKLEVAALRAELSLEAIQHSREPPRLPPRAPR